MYNMNSDRRMHSMSSFSWR